MRRWLSLVAIFCVSLASAAAAQVQVVAAGDIACDPADPDYNGGAGSASRCHQRATSDLVVGLDPAAVLLLGDIQYENGTLPAFKTSFAPTWGRLGARLRPSPGNHEYQTPGAQGYFTYFGAAAGPGYYSFDLGAWHLISLDSNCGPGLGGCGASSPQVRWLRQDLAAHAGRCTLAYWHHPRFSSGLHGSDAAYRVFWRTLYDADADLVLSGHDHEYERYAPQDPEGVLDLERGLRQFVVGTGGKDLRPFVAPTPNSEVRLSQHHGVLRLWLRDAGYDWEFVNEQGIVLDAGSAPCHGAEAPEDLVLGHGRFRISATWRTAETAGVARPGPIATPVAGVLWFFDPSNWEILAKVLDGCALNGHYWVFTNAVTNVGFTLTVTDQQTGRQFVVDNPLGRPAPAVQATSAFPCQ
jgi:hypothetical protein